jgi:hypothetical protein
MSTKVYTGFRFKFENMHKAISFFNKKIEEGFIEDDFNKSAFQLMEENKFEELEKKFHKKVYKNHSIKEYDRFFEVLKSLYSKDYKKEIIYYNAIYCLLNLFKEESDNYKYPTIGDISTSQFVNLWTNKDGYVYGYHGNLKNFKLPTYIEDFYYWDNSDQPEEVSNLEWKKREKYWRKHQNDNKLTAFIDLNNFDTLKKYQKLIFRLKYPDFNLEIDSPLLYLVM